MINICGDVEVIKVIKIAGIYFEDGDIVKLTLRNGESIIGELQINNELDSISINTIDNMYMSSIFDNDFFSIEKASEMDVFMWKLKTDSELQKKLAEVTTKEIKRKNKLEKQIQELQEQL